MRKKSVALCVLLIGQMAGSVLAAGWQAEWIGLDTDCSANTWLCFRKQITLDQDPEAANLKLACDSKYWLWINETLVVFEGQLKRGPTPLDTYFDEVDLKPHLKQGTNTVAVLMWYWGKHGFSHNNSGKAGLIFEAAIDRKRIISDATWKVRRHPAYGVTGKPFPNFRLAEANIHFDARSDIPNWHQADFDDSGWPKATAFGKTPMSPWNQLIKRPVLQWKDSGVIDYEKVRVQNNQDGTKTIICELPYNCHVTPYLKVKAKAGQRIDIQTDNYTGGGSPNVRSVYITRNGIQAYESLGWMNGHNVQYTLPNSVESLQLKYRETGYNADMTGTFECDDERLNLLWEKSKRTLYVTMRDNYMDCPGRERAQWWGDMVNEMGEAFYVFDAFKGPLLAKKGIHELALWQRPDKVVYSPVPAGVPEPDNRDMKVADGSWYKELPRQMLASVGWYGFWTYYLYTGDTQTIVDVYPHVRDYLSLWDLGADGLIKHRAGDWDWTDWGDHKDVPVLENAWVVLAMKAAVEMAKLAGHEEDISGYQAKLASIQASFNKTFWQKNKYRSPGYKGQTDDRAHAMAVIAGLAKPAYYPAIKAVLETQYHASPYMEKYVLESLYLMEAPGQSIGRMKKRWAEQLDSPITTLWEGWGIGKKGYGGGTYNHAWSGGPLTILSQYAAGIAPVEPGFKRFSVTPQFGPLKEIRTTVPTQFGNIRFSAERLGNRHIQLDLTVPKGTTADVEVGDYLKTLGAGVHAITASVERR